MFEETGDMSGRVLNKLRELGISLPAASVPVANYVPFKTNGNILTISGQLPMGPEGLEYVGKLGQNLDVEAGQAAACLCAIKILDQAHAALGALHRIRLVIKIQGFVNTTPDFIDHAHVVNGASNLFADVLGEAGKHARAAVGMASLPFGVAVEVDAVMEFELSS